MIVFWSRYLQEAQSVAFGPWFMCVVATVAITWFITRLVRTGRIHERYTMPYIALGAVMGLVVVAPHVFIRIAVALGFAAPSNLLFLAGAATLLAICIHLTAECTDLRERHRDLVEDYALLEQRVRDLEATQTAETVVDVGTTAVGRPSVSTRVPDVVQAVSESDRQPVDK